MSDFTHLPLPQKLQHWAQQRPNDVALRQKDFGIWGPITWSEYERNAREFGLGLLALGLPPQSRIAIISENRCEWVYTQLGCGMVGMVTVGIYPTSPAAEVAYLLQAADVGAVVCEDQEQLDKVLEAMPELAAVPIMVVIDPKGLRHYRNTAWQSFASVCQLGRDAVAQVQQEQVRTLAQQVPDDIALMIFTSGSTGRPKAAMISYGNITAMALGAQHYYHCDPKDAMLSYLPLCHVAEQIFTISSEIENMLKFSGFIKEAIIVADKRHFVSALIQVDGETVGKWAEEKAITYTNFKSLAEHAAVRDLVAQEVEAVNRRMPQVQHVRKFHLLTKELDHDDGEVTATMKIRRESIAARYTAEVEAMYRG